jgi:hypothetical protein
MELEDFMPFYAPGPFELVSKFWLEIRQYKAAEFIILNILFS